MHADTVEDHDRGLTFDLETIARRHVERRRALAWMAGAGTTALLAGCGGGSGGSASSAGTTTASTTGATTSSTTSSTSSTSSGTTGSTGSTSTSTSSSGGQSGQCIADPTETAGPYPADGTNSASGSTNNALTASGVVRADIRSSFITSATVAAGTLVTITLTVVNVNSACAPLAGYAVYLWHCNAAGAYSLYDVPAESYLRGVQVTDSAGQVTFTTIFPACYSGRYPHMHFEVFTSLSAATSGRNAKLTSQLAMPREICNTVFAQTSLYPNSASRFSGITTGNDNVFGDNSAAQIAAQTPAFTGSVAAGYTATATIGVAP